MTLNSDKDKIDHINDFYLYRKLCIEINKKRTSNEFMSKHIRFDQVNKSKSIVRIDITIKLMV